VSSYRVSPTGTLAVKSGSVRNRQTDTCLDRRLQRRASRLDGELRERHDLALSVHAHWQPALDRGQGRLPGATSQPVDLSLSQGGRYLYLLLRGTGGVAALAVGDRGNLTPLGVVTGALPVADGASGLVAY
jgi:hypothetical protein